MSNNNVTEQTARLPGGEFLPSLEPFAIKPLQKALPGYQAVAILHHNRIQ